MTNLPRRQIEPLAPAPEAFDKVFAGARRRRRRKLAAASATMVVVALVAAGSFALGASLQAADPFDPAGNSKDANNPTLALEGQPSPTPTEASKPPQSGGKTSDPRPVTWLQGRAVDASNRGIAGLYVQPGRPYQKTFGLDGRAPTQTNARGYFKIVCPHAPVLLSTWRLNRDYGDNTAGSNWGATFVGSTNGALVAPRCGSGLVTTTLSQGATVTGQMVATGDCLPDDAYSVWLWLGGNHGTTIRLAGVHSGDKFTYTGLPPGTHTIGVRGQTTRVTVAPGAAAQADADFACDGETEEPPESPDPSSPPPTESPDTGGTPSPTPTPALN